ncbi:GMP synthase [Candidatus Bathyarchaeota archaeon]|nr:GMP synthase [Candidatus Bathyarchaeota archaeon]MBL7079857.1 GMP synthase [Candidatus Bathyarchaeota archaeon]
MSDLDVERFVEEQVKVVREALGDERALIAVSGGVDSTVSAVITHRAIGDNLACVFIDDNFMRLGEPERVKEMLSSPPLSLPVRILRERERFMKALEGLSDAEEKRKAFRETFYQTLGDAARAEGCRFMVQGTIRADIEETAGGIKTQHNILEQIGIDPVERFGYKVVEPIKSLYKYQVREVARFLGAPQVASERQPFPGPGLSVRVVGEITEEKLQQEKLANDAVEAHFERYTPAQYFAAILSAEQEEAPEGLASAAAKSLRVDDSDVEVAYLKERGTGMMDGNRTYGRIATFKFRGGETLGYLELEAARAAIQSMEPGISRVLYHIAGRAEGKYRAAMRAVETRDFLTAEISKVPQGTLRAAADEILEKCSKVVGVYYDVTPKPPATVEYE